jgi:hypothetical protein
MKFKIGDRVKIIGSHDYGGGYEPAFEWLLAKCGTVVSAEAERGRYQVDIDSGAYPRLTFIEQDLELISTENISSSNNRGGVMSVINNLFKGKTRKALEHFELVNGGGGLTEKGRGEFVDLLYNTDEKLKAAFDKKVVEAYEEATKK